MALERDPIEDDPKFKPWFDAADREARLRVAQWEGQMGYCHLLCGAKQDILKRKYGIEWRTPMEMNPDVLFD